MAERPLPGPDLAQQPAAERLGRPRREPLLRQPGEREQRRLVGGAGEHRRRVQDGPGVGVEPLDALQHGVADRRRHLDAVQPAPGPAVLPADQVGAVVHQPHRLLHGQGHALGAGVQEVRELFRHIAAGQHRRHERGRLAGVQRSRGQPDQMGVRGQPGGQPQQQGGRRHLVAPERQHEADRLGPAGHQEQQELQGRLVRPVHVLQREDGDVEPVEDLGERAEQPVPRGGGVLQRLGGGRQFAGPLGEQRPQRSRQPAETQPGNVVVDPFTHRVHDGPEGVRHAQLEAGAGQGAPSPLLLGGQELAQQPRLADARLALDQDDRGGVVECLGEGVQFVAAADELRRGQGRKPTVVPAISCDHRHTPWIDRQYARAGSAARKIMTGTALLIAWGRCRQGTPHRHPNPSSKPFGVSVETPDRPGLDGMAGGGR
ncbi:hypothetical protein SRB5_56980 [Streptomyces sp. RB5]|uniref:Uncharacterized protein n=1 Tax=Streptomyces smaragdinus TaxID=2585196 RepID=A0A7K0CPV4_9ACTN|nr:hypothetical protein [Streptomyces smaragdinus]